MIKKLKMTFSMGFVLSILISCNDNHSRVDGQYRMRIDGDTTIVEQVVPDSMRYDVALVDGNLIIRTYFQNQRFGPTYIYDKEHILVKYEFYMEDECEFFCLYNRDGQIIEFTGSPAIKTNFSVIKKQNQFVEFRDYFANVPHMSVQICRFIDDSLIHCNRENLESISYPYRDTILVDSNFSDTLKTHITFFQKEYNLELSVEGYSWVPDSAYLAKPKE